MSVKNIHVKETSKYLFQQKDAPCVINLLYSNGDPAIVASYICYDSNNIKIFIDDISSSLFIEAIREYIHQVEHLPKANVAQK